MWESFLLRDSYAEYLCQSIKNLKENKNQWLRFYNRRKKKIDKNLVKEICAKNIILDNKK